MLFCKIVFRMCYLFSAMTTKKNYPTNIVLNPPVDEMYDISVFNPIYPLVDYPKSNLYYIS